ncbi:MAG: hypothetical protein A3C90_03605 [Candidatus Magasanikbacteria bacterium RIFCSPHIGHO2_02_FULL_51_14]|uniref:Uncharacterized protein n=1 Tax=Candidatus Magasanikbacteria bacterium RIFCSPHIGHO2_02_FULL_51_14 TaxID=1798683 RepID=A0A1F6MEK5_9BACT|nr:MAG: hypothetical protein A3C90_03605 [Candidatus Magasanikbacteria bacterium RIFCSPHIGHO2_02_FULL_51_14]
MSEKRQIDLNKLREDILAGKNEGEVPAPMSDEEREAEQDEPPKGRHPDLKELRRIVREGRQSPEKRK